ncbi:response regulator transcription factor [Paenibacillus donghaensis]|uniref:DNA-binding response regulator n=1 Tax=Paenibacillus donghaensis TaxID=414771 RepID=A0A2Z2KJ58_9BACL|nr:response regulator transcription factor [Paenibacillus donghaensis]ASA19801.1 DNA-binding response regulator [Paenibacillus donghaensis]
MRSKKILIIEDEEGIRDILSYSLRKEGFEILEAANGQEGLMLLERNHADLVLLDLMLPDVSGFDICKRLSYTSRTPVIMITAKSDMLDKVLGMELGADDYITKPFDIREVIARIRAIFRRIDQKVESGQPTARETIHLGKTIVIYRNEREVLKDGERVFLTNKEYELLPFFVEHNRMVFNRSELLDKVWGFEYAGDTRTVDIHVQRIRKKLDDNHAAGSMIVTVFGVGYKLDAVVRT